MSVTVADYDALDELLRNAGAAIALAELHGALCGLLAAAGRDVASEWLGDQVCAFDGPSPDVDAASEELDALESASWTALSGTAFGFTPLLPDDDEDLSRRARALGQWCLGFIGGLALGGWADGQTGDGQREVAEIVSDFAEISRAGLSEVEEADFEAAECSFSELAEFVRVGVQLVFEVLSPRNVGEESPTTHH